MTPRILLFAGMLVAGTGTRAAEAPPPSEFPQGWYVAPMATYMLADKHRCQVDNGLGGSVMLGHRGEFAALEVWGQYLPLHHGDCRYTVPNTDMTPGAPPRVTVTEPAGDLSLNGGGLALVIAPFVDNRILARAFGVVGFGVILREKHPQYDDGKSMFADLGVGYLQPFRLFGLDLAARAEARYRYDVQQPPYHTDQDPPPKHSFQDVIFNLGLQFQLSKPEALPPSEPEKVNVVAAAEPAPAPEAPPTAPTAEPVAPATDEGPVTIETAKAGDTIVLHGVNFETAKAKLTSNAKTILDGVAADLNKRPELKIEIGGHTDSRGSDSYNQKLSEKRAQAVLDYLAGRGVDAMRLSAVGYGEGKPVDSNDTDEGRERNRRVELKVLQ